MKDSNIILFPQPDPGLPFEDRIAEVIRLAVETADILDIGGHPVGIRDLLDRLEGASHRLSDLGKLVLRGKAKTETEANMQSIHDVIARARLSLDELEKTGRFARFDVETSRNLE